MKLITENFYLKMIEAYPWARKTLEPWTGAGFLMRLLKSGKRKKPLSS